MNMKAIEPGLKQQLGGGGGGGGMSPRHRVGASRVGPSEAEPYAVQMQLRTTQKY